ncbi:hypothetical protein AMTR_s00073p00146090 [Amborella trichopoda]|uniref:Uncharacterized protein n=1 Tax=Amborella trichopoda TaxID=13333 RepID=W1NNN7_AMBTC|nr:hypothetical protein AMTR_s00073p00146090 [Amborella trichopoda]
MIGDSLDTKNAIRRRSPLVVRTIITIRVVQIDAVKLMGAQEALAPLDVTSSMWRALASSPNDRRFLKPLDRRKKLHQAMKPTRSQSPLNTGILAGILNGKLGLLGNVAGKLVLA